MASVDPDVIRIEARLAEAVETEKRAAARVKELTESLNAARIAQSVGCETDTGANLETELEALPQIEAKSKKCDFVRDAPPALVEKVRAVKGGIKGKAHHFTASTTEPTLFRFGKWGA